MFQHFPPLSRTTRTNVATWTSNAQIIVARLLGNEIYKATTTNVHFAKNHVNIVIQK